MEDALFLDVAAPVRRVGLLNTTVQPQVAAEPDPPRLTRQEDVRPKLHDEPIALLGSDLSTQTPGLF